MAAQLVNGVLYNQPFVRTTEEFSLDLRPPSLARDWGDSATKWKHTIEPDITYRYVNGVNDFGRFLRFDEDETLTDTSEVEYSLTQRLFRKQGRRRCAGPGDLARFAEIFLRSDLRRRPGAGAAQRVSDTRCADAVCICRPRAAFFADHQRFADHSRRPYDAQLRVDYDPQRGQITGVGTLLKLKPYRESFLTLADFSTINIPPTSPANPQYLSAAIEPGARAGGLWRFEPPRMEYRISALSYDVTQHVFQNQLAQLSYNGSCCGIGFEYRRLTLGNVRVGKSVPAGAADRQHRLGGKCAAPGQDLLMRVDSRDA